MRELPPGYRLLELGPGPAQIALLLRRGDICWVGLERSLDCLSSMHRQLSGGVIVDLELLPRLPSSFDAVLAGDTLEHLKDPERMLHMIRDALLPGGRLLLSVPNVANLYVRLSLLFGRFPYAERGILDRTHLVFFTAKSLREMVQNASFVVERTAVSTIPLRLIWRRMPKPLSGALSFVLDIAGRLFPTLFGYQLLLLARRI